MFGRKSSRGRMMNLWAGADMAAKA
jgi:hypothetical protein